MYLQQFFVEGLGHASYLIGSDQTGEAAVVDPRRDVTPYLEAASAAGLRIRHIFETHVHNDFLSGAKSIADDLGATYHASAEAGLTFPYHAVREGDEIRIGELLVRVLFTPGHTPEHVSYVVSDTSRAGVPVLVFTGGDLLVGSVGRPDLLGMELGRELAPKLFDSLFGKLLKLEDYVEVMPTHGAGSLCGRAISTKRTTTIGYERRFNPFLQRTEKQAFVDFVLEGNPYVPAYYQQMRPGNLAGRDGFFAPPPRGLSAEEVQHAISHDAVVIDTRSAAAFGGGHVTGAYSIGMGPMLATWVGSLLPFDVPIVLVLEREGDWEEVVNALGRIGYERVVGYLQGGMAAWQERGLPLARVEQIDVHELDRRRRSDPALQVLDVRMPSEWAGGVIPGARLLSLTDVPTGQVDLDPERPAAVVCGTGYRSSIATSFLERRGLKKLINVLGGMTAYNGAGLETTVPDARSGEAASERRLTASRPGR